MACFVLETFLVTVLSVCLVGICLIPLLYAHMVIIMLDAFYMAERLKKGFPIMQGECGLGAACFMLDKMVTPTFVTGSSFVPPEYLARMSRVTV